MDRDRFRGCLLGLACGDAVGTTVEFRPPGTFPAVTDMVGGGPFGLPTGAWTDDTSMALCLAESLVETGGFDPVDQLRRYVRWYRDGHRSSTGECFDIGGATRAALERFERTGEPFPGDAAPDAAGNGPLMKLAPVAMAFAADAAAAVQHAGDSARTTHGAPEAVDAARAFAALLVGELRRETVPYEPLVPAVGDAVASTREPPAVRGGGYVVHALEAALWAVRTTSSVRGRRPRRGQPRRRRRHDRRDRRSARRRPVRRRRHPCAMAGPAPRARGDRALRRRAARVLARSVTSRAPMRCLGRHGR